jgi:hypothetical protein
MHHYIVKVPLGGEALATGETIIDRLEYYNGSSHRVDEHDNRPAIHIYKKYGFKIVGTCYGRGYFPKIPYYVMEKGCRRGK